MQSSAQLSTINVSANKYSGRARSPSVSSNTSVESETKPLMTAPNNRSVNNVNNMNGFPENNGSGSVGIPLGPSRRSNSRDMTIDAAADERNKNNMIPSTIIGPPPRAPSPYNNMPPPGPHHHRPHSHRRAESWSGNFPPIAPPSPGYPPYNSIGSPMMAFSNETQSERNPLLGEPQMDSMGRFSNNARRKRKSLSGGHRRSNSLGAAYPGMPGNAFFAPPGSELPPPPPPRTMEQFSPRSEFMKLTSSFRTPDSPSGRKRYSPQGTPRSMSGKVSFSPHVNNISPTIGYGSINVTNAPGMAMPDFPAAGGEAVFLAQKQGSSRHHRESTRKRHMRQRSAQLFMEEFKGVEQPLACRDVAFLLLFLFHIVGIAFLGTTYGHDAFDFDPAKTGLGGEEVKLYYGNVIYVAGLSGVFAVALSLLAFAFMTLIARKFVQIALGLAITISFAWGTIGTGLSPKNVVPITGFVALALSIAYAFIVWERIPFCASNLVTALSGIRDNLGTVAVAISFQLISLLYCIYFIFVVVGVYDAIQMEKLSLSEDMQMFIYVMLGISFYWTYNVILNIVQVTTAKVISDWWYHPEDVNVFSSFTRSLVYYMGSICFGSLLVGPVRFIRQLSVFFRPSNDSDSSLMCLHECLNFIQTCISSCVDGLAHHFNSWAFTYVGIYGYGFMDAGSNATELFRTRGWTMIVTDDLVPNILLMISLVIGGATGLFAHLLEGLDDVHISSLGQPGPVSFCMGVALGLVVTSVNFGIISSSVNAVLVCFASSPVDFENNHPQLSHEMRAAWREVWPGCMDAVDLRVALANPSLHTSQRNSFTGSLNGIPAEFL